MVLTPIQRFYNSNTNPVTRKNYEFQLNKFWKWGKITPEVFTKLDKPERRDIVLQYIEFNKMKTEKRGSPAPSSYIPMIASIMSFCGANELDMNWKLIKKSLPKITELSNRYPYLDEDVEKMLKVTRNLRDVAFIHLMASTSPRIGEVNKIRIRDVIPFRDGAILVMYARTISEYRVPMTPEAYGHIRDYLETRNNKNNPDAPLFTTLGLTERPMKSESVKEFMKRFRSKVENLAKDGSRKDKAPNNAFRKRLQECYSSAKLDFRYADYFLNHNLGKQDKHYFAKMSNEKLWDNFKDAIPYITIDKSDKLKFDNQQQKVIIDEYETKFEDKFKQLKERYEETTKILEVEAFREKMINYFQKQLDGKGHVHVDEKYRGFMRRWTQTESLEDLFVLLSEGADEETQKIFKILTKRFIEFNSSYERNLKK